MRAIRKKPPVRMNSPHQRSEQATGFNRIGGMTIRNRTKNFAYPEVWGYIRPKAAEHAFECHQCGQKFPDFDDLRRHEIDCVNDDASAAPL